jgi:sugar lactone lactonase YvrE
MPQLIAVRPSIDFIDFPSMARVYTPVVLSVRKSHLCANRSALAFVIGLAFGPAVLAQTTVSIDATKSIRTVDERVFGITALGTDAQAGSSQTIYLVQNAGVRVVRIPGGMINDNYHWLTDSADGTSWMWWTWPSGFDAFGKLISGIDSQAIVTVNYGSGTPQEAAAWVAYANADAALHGTPRDLPLGVDSKGTDWQTAGYWSALRNSAPLATEDGSNFLRISRSTPFVVKYWEIGNECFGFWELDQQAIPHDPYTYAIRWAAYMQRMKAVDPTIKVGAVAMIGEDSFANNTNHPATNPRTGLAHNGWTPVMLATLASLGVTPDFLIYHRYEQAPGSESDSGLLQSALTWPNDAKDLRQQLSDYLGSDGGSVELCVTENNSVGNNPGKQTTSLVNGLFMADSLGNVLQTEFNSLVWFGLRCGPAVDSGGQLIGNQSSSLYGWRLFGDYGVLSTPSSASGEQTYYDAYPTYYVMKLLQHFARGGDAVVLAQSNNSLLSVYSSLHTDGSLALLAINKSPTVTQSAAIALQGYFPMPTGAVYTYGIPQDSAAKNGSGSADIAVGSLTDASTAFTHSFAPYSATVIVLSIGTPAAPTINMQPANQSANAGQTAVFSVAATGVPIPNYQWQRQAAGTSTWTALSDNGAYSGSATAALTVNPVAAAMNGDSFRCVLTNFSGSATTMPAMLVVETPLAVATLAGQAGNRGHADGTGTGAQFNALADIAIDSSSNIYVADTGNDTVRKITPAGVVTTLAGQPGVSGSSDGSGSALFNHPAGIAIDGAGNAFIADTNNNTIRKVVIANGAVSTLAGQAGIAGSSDGTGTAAAFNGPSGIAVDSTGNLFISDTLNHAIREITPAGVVTTIAGTAGSSGFADAAGSAARFHGPQGLALDSSGDLFVADTNNNAIRKLVTSTGVVTTIAGQTGVAGSADGSNSQAQFHFPSGITVDTAGNIYVADTDNQTLREIASSGSVSTLAGLAGSSGSADGVGTAARFAFPTGVALDGTGGIYVADTNNDTIRFVGTPSEPTIAVQPQTQAVAAGSSVTFSVTATGKPVPTYQWNFGGAPISGATSSSYILSNAQAANGGNYTVVVSNAVGSVTSNQATLTVNAAQPPPSGGGGGSSGGGGGAPSGWFCGALLLLAAVRMHCRRMKLPH